MNRNSCNEIWGIVTIQYLKFRVRLGANIIHFTNFQFSLNAIFSIKLNVLHKQISK
jgi:hypothetical protein